MIHVTPEITLDEAELVESFIRASGPGGQNVNKVSSAVQLRFDARGSRSLADEVARMVAERVGLPVPVSDEDVIGTVQHGFTHFTLQLALAVGEAREHVDGEWWPVDELAAAGLPTLFARAAEAMRRGR